MKIFRLVTALAACAGLAANTAYAYTDVKASTVTAGPVVAPKLPAATPAPITMPKVSAMSASPQGALSPVALLQPGTWALSFINAQGQPVAVWPVVAGAVTADGKQPLAYCPVGRGSGEFQDASLTINTAQGTISGAFMEGHSHGPPRHGPSPGDQFDVTITGAVTPVAADPGTFKTVTGTAALTTDNTPDATYSFTLVPVDVAGLAHNANAPKTACTWQYDSL
jgi:hypothetical protein